ncbi:ATP synthase subunit C lysine N-methyltransferase isoform X2 [Nannospalax galili]|uniref:ATP synthase subunit C lysine N-methyltransferase isoform X2 n=1 Tax=Nannospalax galili TaxID=1026970 RepID=UPI00111C7899|nr:ATP synthase subunit C lysine N-methyltransferase isoform X2 [Nannospalax galili]
MAGSSLEMPEEERQVGPVPPASLAADGLRKSSWGLLLTGIVGGALVAVYAVATPFVTPALRRICLPFVPATPKQIENVVKMLHRRRGPLVDIGSGDGRIVIAAAKEGFEAVGYELNPWLVWYSRYCAWREGVQGSTRFHVSDLWKVTFSQYSNVVIFGVPQMMLQLEKKLELELEDDARVIACRFPFPHWTPDHIIGEGIDTVWAYDMSTFRGREKRPWKRDTSGSCCVMEGVLIPGLWNLLWKAETDTKANFSVCEVLWKNEAMWC